MSTALTVILKGELLPLIGERESLSRDALSSSSPSTSEAHTRAAYARNATPFLAWAEARGISDLRSIEPIHVAAYIEGLGKELSAPTVKQHLATLRELFDWLVTGQVVPTNPASSVRSPRYSASKGLTPVLDGEEARELLDSIDTSNVVGLRERALIGLLTYTFARVSAAAGMRVEDYYPRGKRFRVRLHEKHGKVIDAACHHHLEHYLDEYIAAAGIASDKDFSFALLEGKRKRSLLTPCTETMCSAWSSGARRQPNSALRLGVTRSGQRVSRRTSRMAAGSSSRRRWPDTPMQRRPFVRPARRRYFAR